MDRRSFLKSASGAIAVTAAGSHAAVARTSADASVSAPAHLKGQRTLHIGLAWPDNGQGFGDVAQSFAATVSNLTDNALHISYTAPPAGSDASLDAARTLQGDLDGMFGVERLLLAHDRASAYFVGLPGSHGLAGRHLQNWLSMAGGQLLWDDVAAEADIKPLLVGHSAGPSLLWARQPLDERNPFSGQSMVVEGLARDVAIGLGSEVVTDLKASPGQAMADGALDLCDAAGLAASVGDDLPGKAPYLYEPGFYRHGVATAFGLKLETWHGLSKAHAAILELAAATTFAQSLDWAEAHHSLMQSALTSLEDLEVLGLNSTATSAIDRVSDAVVAHVAAGGSRARRINAQYLAFRRRMLVERKNSGV